MPWRYLSSTVLAPAGVAVPPLGLFFAAAHGSPGRLLLLAGVLTSATGLALWPAGRLLDRLGPLRGLRLALVVAAAGSGALAALLDRDAPTGVQVAGAALVGVTYAPLVDGPRAALPWVVPPLVLARASTVEATSVEVALLVAPVIAAPLGARGPGPVLLAAAVLLIAGCVVTPTAGERPSDDASEGALAAARSSSPWRTWRLSGLAFLLGSSGGLLEPALALRAAELRSPVAPTDAAAFLALGLGSLLGGAATSRIAWLSRPERRLGLLVVHAVGLAVAAASSGAAALVALLAAGAPVAALNSLPPGTSTWWSLPDARRRLWCRRSPRSSSAPASGSS